MKKAYTVIELIFVIVIIGILAGVALPKLGGTATMAYMSKGKSTLAAVRSAIATERQKRILRGDTAAITSLGNVFTNFSAAADGSTAIVLEYPPAPCTDIGCWSTSNNVDYTFYRDASTNCTYKLESNRFVDKTSSPGCTELEE